MLITGYLVGCSTADKTFDHTASGSVGNDSLSEERVILPDTFEASIGGFLGTSFRVKLQPDGILQYQYTQQNSTSSPITKKLLVEVTDDQWREFRGSLNKANVWAWKKDYIDPRILDGTQWNLNIKFGDTTVMSHGSNAYPPQPDFEQFLAAVVQLLGGHPFQ